jgi:hypothetical protein
VIVLEGPDGGGKTTLLRQLVSMYPNIPVHSRASSSGVAGGPVANLYEWAVLDVQSWRRKPLHFYDRHPFVSEYVYGPTCRGIMDDRFHTTRLRRSFARDALLIVCLPPLEAVRASVSAERDMVGVSTHIDAIWHLYASLRATWTHPAGLLFYDYTRDTIHRLVPHINAHVTRWKRDMP